MTESGFLKPLLDLLDQHQVELDRDILERAYELAKTAHTNQKRKSGEPYIGHPVAVACILVNLLDRRADTAILAAALMHDVVEDTETVILDLEKQFGNEVAHLVDGVTKITGLDFKSVESEQAENFRKMMLSMAKDVRVILIKLADRLHNMRTLEHLSQERQESIATETLEIYAPMAHRLGIGRIKWELEDLSLKVLKPEEYRRVASFVDLKREEREAVVEGVIQPVEEVLEDEGVFAEIHGRAKHFYSISRKMRQQERSFDAIHDLFGVRIVTDTKANCYRVLGILHDIYKPVPERFKDYIATPKANLYQSLHTTVIGPGGRLVEFQIRTREMHSIAEYGIAAHYSYKEGSQPDEELNERLGGILEFSSEGDDPGDYLDLLKTSLYQDEVFVFTPKGELKRLPRGASALDFAFLIHTDIGLRTVGARVNGRMVPLRYKLKNGDVLELITQAKAKPSEYWLSILFTSRAKQKVRHWIKEQRREDSIDLGREMLERELRRRRKKLPKDKELIDVAQSLGCETTEHLFAAIGQGDVSSQQAFQRIFPELKEKKKPSPLARLGTFGRRHKESIEIDGVSNLMLRFAKCCQPIPGDQIVGVITRGRGMSVHKVDCPNAFDEVVGEERRVELSWNVPEDQSFMVKIVVRADDRTGMLADLANAITGSDTNIKDAGMKGAEGEAEGTFLVEVRNLNQLDRVLKTLKTVKGVIEVERAQVQEPGD